MAQHYQGRIDTWIIWNEVDISGGQWHTWNGMRRTCLPARDCLEALEATTEGILRDVAAHRPGIANLLSGGIDSSYLQAVWNRVYTGDDRWSIYTRDDSLAAHFEHTVAVTDEGLRILTAAGVRV